MHRFGALGSPLAQQRRMYPAAADGYRLCPWQGAWSSRFFAGEGQHRSAIAAFEVVAGSYADFCRTTLCHYLAPRKREPTEDYASYDLVDALP